MPAFAAWQIYTFGSVTCCRLRSEFIHNPALDCTVTNSQCSPSIDVSRHHHLHTQAADVVVVSALFPWPWLISTMLPVSIYAFLRYCHSGQLWTLFAHFAWMIRNVCFIEVPHTGWRYIFDAVCQVCVVGIYHVSRDVSSCDFCCVPFKSWSRVHEITWSW